MAEITLVSLPVAGANLSIGENWIVERDDLALVSIAIPLKKDAAVKKALKSGWGLTMPKPGMASVNGDMRAVMSTADQILLAFHHSGPDANKLVSDKLNGVGYTTDQTDNWFNLEISGPDTILALERICGLDLYDAVCPTGATGRTTMEHIGVLFLRLDKDRFLLMSPRSSAQSFLHAIKTSYQNVS